ncbi:glycolate oxidase subunit GlcD [Virgibacillus salexigens]|uniref:glycolate oxidase subunit GlcD n=1 Tax=Virgibacillus massiliensis TaxID=1462526 RepID=UPI00136EE351|nr:glycolate oxidase subunit GlcD [Virgibacillus massiliensis]MYL43070.1 glycolate oxidase subunit GlcD [Virgibacillus massiliensis]
MLHSEVKGKLLAIVGAENVEDNNASLLAYSYDSTARFQALPDAMVAPRNTEEVAGVVKVCNEHKIPIAPRGSGTNLCAGTTPTKGGIVLIFKHMNHILEIDQENLTMTVEPGVYTKDILNAAIDVGLFYPPDPGSMHISQIGGNISENSGGLRGLKYGVTRDYVLGLEIVLPNGEVIQTGGKLAKDVAGYDLTRLYIGAEGTLGVITKAILKLIPQPETKKTMLALYEDLEAAAETVSAIIANRIIPATLEFLDQATVQVVEDFAEIGLPVEAKAVLLIEQDGPPEVVDRDMDKIEELCKDNRAFDVQVAKTVEEAEQLTAARRSALSALSRLKPTTILEDATVPRSEIAKMVKAIGEIAEKYQLNICTFGHAGDGNLHPTCLTDARDEAEIELVEKAFEEIFQQAVALGGTITGEHGVGMMKLPYLHLKAGEHGIEAMRSIKQAIDPNGIMNPGKMIEPKGRQRMVVEHQ